MTVKREMMFRPIDPAPKTSGKQSNWTPAKHDILAPRKRRILEAAPLVTSPLSSKEYNQFVQGDHSGKALTSTTDTQRQLVHNKTTPRPINSNTIGQV
jgi:hypothetical protein